MSRSRLLLFYLLHGAGVRAHVVAFGWTEHDGRRYGKQDIYDADVGVKLTSRYVNPGNVRACIDVPRGYS